MNRRFALCLPLVAAILGLSGCSDNAPEEGATKSAGTQETIDPLARLGIEIAEAKSANGLPIASVPGVVTLPPEAKVAVTSVFQGAVVKNYVIEGQFVRRGQPLALVQASETIQTRGDLARAKSQVELAQARAKRLNLLAEEGIIAGARADEANAELQQAQATLAEQERIASLAGVGPDGTATLRAPISGRVAHVGVVTGGLVGGTEAPFVIEADGAYQVELQLPERLARDVRPGMPVQITLQTDSSEPMVVGGQILAVSPSIDPATRSVLARASIGGAPGIVAGRNVSVTITGNASQDGVAIPSGAVTKIAGEDHVFVREGKTYKPRRVSIASTTGTQSVISDGLKAGEIVATSSVAELKAMSAE